MFDLAATIPHGPKLLLDRGVISILCPPEGPPTGLKRISEIVSSINSNLPPRSGYRGPIGAWPMRSFGATAPTTQKEHGPS